MKKILLIIAVFLFAATMIFLATGSQKNEVVEPEVQEMKNQTAMIQAAFSTLMQQRDEMLNEEISNLVDSVQVKTRKELERKFTKELMSIQKSSVVTYSCDSIQIKLDSIRRRLENYKSILGNIDTSGTGLRPN